jgi:hypothetical protein
VCFADSRRHLIVRPTQKQLHHSLDALMLKYPNDPEMYILLKFDNVMRRVHPYCTNSTHPHRDLDYCLPHQWPRLNLSGGMMSSNEVSTSIQSRTTLPPSRALPSKRRNNTFFQVNTPIQAKTSIQTNTSIQASSSAAVTTAR